MRVGLDGTPLLGPRTGVGRIVEGLVQGLRDGPDEIVLTAFTWRGAGPLREEGVPVRHRRVPARALRESWERIGWPPVEAICGPVDVFHGTNYVLPPLRAAAGVLSVHDLSFLTHADTVRPVTLRLRRELPKAFGRAGAVCVLSETMADELCATYALDRARVFVSRPGVAPVFQQALPAGPDWLAARGLPQEYAVFVGSREPRKGLPVLLDAWRVLWERGEAPPLCLVGPAGWGQDLELEAMPPGSVVTPGYVPDADLPALLASAQLLVMPSRYEGFGIPPVEALATGTPVVVSDLPVFHEVLGEQAWYAEVGSPEALMDALRGALDAGRGSAETQRARRAHAAAYTWEACAAQTRRAYQAATA